MAFMIGDRYILRIRRILLLSFTVLFFNLNTYAQSEENNAWLFISHTQKLSDKFDLLADVQLRSADHLTYFSTILLRTALNFNINKQQSVAVGYAHKGDWEIEENKKVYLPEHRIYEQYLHNFTVERLELTIRGRLEQRFVYDDEYQFSQRARVMISAQIPLVANPEFTKGIYANLQNEVFINVQHKGRVNGSFLDQNRPYISAGYRFNKHFDVEFGYTRWLQRKNEGEQVTNIMQLMVTSSF